MSDEKPSDATPTARPVATTGKAASDERARRLAQALRDNLKRRKAASRGTPSSGPRQDS